jgi:hypothetical protein
MFLEQIAMSTKAKILTAYFSIGLLYAIYAAIWGVNAYKGFFYNLGGGLIWPVMLFPGLGKIFGAVILLVFIGAVLAT